MNRKYSFKSRRGFTIIELIIVMLILVILAVVAGLFFSGLSDRAKSAADNANLEILNTATAHYAADKNAVNGDIFYGVTTDAGRMQLLIDRHFLPEPVTPLQKNFQFTWDAARQAWILENLSPGSSQSVSSQASVPSSASSFASSSTPVVPVLKVTLNYNSITLTASNRTKTLIATVTPSNATNKSVTWTSSNSAVAKVDADGVVSYGKSGTATITAKTVDGNKKATCKVTVK